MNASLIIVVIAAIVLYVLKNHFSRLPGEDDMDSISFAVARFSKLIFKQPFPSYLEPWTIPKARESNKFVISLIEKIVMFQDPSLAKIEFEDTMIPVPASYIKQPQTQEEYHMGIRIYNHDKSSTADRKKVLIWYHGGGWVLGSMYEDHNVCLRLAKLTGYIIVNVDYRLAPEYLFPTAMEDGYKAFEWVVGNIGRYGGDPHQVILAGESAGGNLAATVTSEYLKNLPEGEESRTKGLLLVYPVSGSHCDMNDPTVAAYADTAGLLSWKTMESFRHIYFNTTDYDVFASNRDPRYAPLYTSDEILKQYPPTVVVVAKYDVLTSEILQFVEKIARQGVDIVTLTYNTIHAFFSRDMISVYGTQALNEAVEQLMNKVRKCSK